MIKRGRSTGKSGRILLYQKDDGGIWSSGIFNSSTNMLTNRNGHCLLIWIHYVLKCYKGEILLPPTYITFYKYGFIFAKGNMGWREYHNSFHGSKEMHPSDTSPTYL
jgi:hypothetical protein